VLSKSRPEKNVPSKLIITFLGDFPELFWGLKDKLMNAVSLLRCTSWVFQKIKTGHPEHIEAESGITETPPGVPRKVPQATRYHSSLSTSLYLAKQTFTFQIHLPPTTWYHGVEKWGGRGGMRDEGWVIKKDEGSTFKKIKNEITIQINNHMFWEISKILEPLREPKER
jgi:hypothetical protein